MDGGVAAFIPRPPTPHAVKVCCFPVNEVLATVQVRFGSRARGLHGGGRCRRNAGAPKTGGR